jgi:hypothetical protein
MAVMDMDGYTYPANAMMSKASYDGTYVWFAVYPVSGGARLYRLRPSDNALIRPDGSVGDFTNAYVDATVGAGPHANGAVVSDGTTVLWDTDNTGGAQIHRYRCSDMAHLGSISGTSSLGYETAAFYANGFFYWGGKNNGANRSVLYKIDATTFGVSTYQSPDGTGLVDHVVSAEAGFSYSLSTGGSKIEKINLSTMARAYVADLGFVGVDATCVTYDPARDEVWMGTFSTPVECFRMRGSDGVWLDRAGNVVGSPAGMAGGDSYIGQAVGISFDGTTIWTSGSSKSVQRRSTGTTQLVGDTMVGAGSRGLWRNRASYLIPGVKAGECFYLTANPNNATFTTAGIYWFLVESAAILTRVTPRVGKGLDLTFTGAVSVSGPTIDGPVDGIGVPAVTIPQASHIDIDIDVPPTHPLGEAEVPAAPSPPKGGGAFQL